jgi:hypothetical protein
VPWINEACRRAGTVHVGGTADEVAASEAAVGAGQPADRPYVLVAQQSLVDPSRAPAGRHTLWAYCHVPNGSTFDMTERIEAQIERFAPGFRDLVLGRHVAGPAWFESYNPSYVGGDIAGGAHGGLQLVFRPTISVRRTARPTHGVPVLGVNPSGRRRPRHVRPPRRERRAEQACSPEGRRAPLASAQPAARGGRGVIAQPGGGVGPTAAGWPT